MKLVAVKRNESRAGDRLIDQSHCLRARVFQDRLKWSVTTRDGREFDEYDDLDPTYILATDLAQTRVIGCARLLTADGPTMLAETFPQLLGGRPAPSGRHVVESSRFCVDTAAVPEAIGARGVHLATISLFAGILEWALAHGCLDVVTVTDLRLERIFARAGLPFVRFGPPINIGATVAVAGTIPVTPATSFAMRPTGYISLYPSELGQAA